MTLPKLPIHFDAATAAGAITLAAIALLVVMHRDFASVRLSD